MANITRENIGQLHDRINVTVSKADYSATFDKKLKEFSKTANIPGFRKGMVPAGLVKKMAGQSLFSEVVMNCISENLDKYIKDEKLVFFGRPLLATENNNARIDMNSSNDVTVGFEIGIKPDITIPAVESKATITRYRIPVTDDMFADEVKNLLRKAGREEVKEAVSFKEDVLYFTVNECDADGNITGEEQKETKNLPVEKFPASVQDSVMGKIKDSVMVINPKTACTADELIMFINALGVHKSNADKNYLLKIDNVYEVFPAEFGVELYERVFPSLAFTDADHFKVEYRKEIQRQLDNFTEQRLHAEMHEMLVHTTEIPLPEAFMKRLLVENREDNSQPMPTAEEVEQSYVGMQHTLKWQLIAGELAGKFGINVSREEIKNDIGARMKSYYGMSFDEEIPWLDQYVEKTMKDENTVTQTFERILDYKIFKALEQVLTISENEVTDKEFIALPDAHSKYHHHEHAH